ncbi:MAG TPA: Holliday junction resolvase RuvX [Actinobacteria bacterium]|nr:Holliday junction resolvase RuvX [Actinomycetota bacterium]
MTGGRVVALDHGTKRIGIAVSDPLGITAQPVGVVPAGAEFIADLGRLMAGWEVDVIVVGLPVGLDGTEGAAAASARAFAAEVGAATGLPTVLYDERFSTVVAERAMIAGGALPHFSGRRLRNRISASASR